MASIYVALSIDLESENCFLKKLFKLEAFCLACFFENLLVGTWRARERPQTRYRPFLPRAPVGCVEGPLSFLGGPNRFYTIPPSDAERTPLMGRVPWAVPPRYCSLVVRCLSSLWMDAVGGARMLVSLFSLPSALFAHVWAEPALC